MYKLFFSHHLKVENSKFEHFIDIKNGSLGKNLSVTYQLTNTCILIENDSKLDYEHTYSIKKYWNKINFN